MSRITTDSQYLRSASTSWIHWLEGRGWLTADHKPVKNAELWQRLDALVRNAAPWCSGAGSRTTPATPDNERADAASIPSRRCHGAALV